jgi:Fe-S-cluster containining protein
MITERAIKLTAPLENIIDKLPEKEVANARNILLGYVNEYDLMIKNDVPAHKRAIVYCTMVEEAIADYLTKFPETAKKITCKAGCSSCCKNVINKITIDEAALLKEYCEFNEIPIDMERLKVQADCKTQKQWNKLQPKDKKCVFLGDDDLCQVYEVRPISCRKVLLISDPKLCKRTTPCRINRVVSPLAEVIDCAVLNVHKPDTFSRSLSKVLCPQPERESDHEEEFFHTPNPNNNSSVDSSL